MTKKAKKISKKKSKKEENIISLNDVSLEELAQALHKGLSTPPVSNKELTKKYRKK